MAQIDASQVAYSFSEPERRVGLDIRHWVLILLIASFPIIPMPIAGGTPILATVTALIYCTFFLFPSKAVYLDSVDQTYVILGVSLFAWEAIGLLFHISNQDVLFVLARGFWIAIAVGVIMGMNVLYDRAGLRPITNLLVVSLMFLLIAMWIEINFYPNREYGRDFGAFQLPFPRATGVPNSDGKLGTFLSICLCYFLFLRPPMPRWQGLVLCIGPFLGLMSLQSRSTLLAISIIVAIYFVYSLFSSRSIFTAFLKLALVLITGGYILINVFALIDAVIGQNIFRQNVFGRFELFALAFKIIPEAPMFGLGARAIEAHGESGNIHNSFLAMAVKSGLPAAILSAVTIFMPVLLFVRDVKLSVFVVAVCLAMFAEHFFYPGRFNEYQIICFMVAKLAWQHHRAQRLMVT